MMFFQLFPYFQHKWRYYSLHCCSTVPISQKKAQTLRQLPSLFLYSRLSRVKNPKKFYRVCFFKKYLRFFKISEVQFLLKIYPPCKLNLTKRRFPILPKLPLKISKKMFKILQNSTKKFILSVFAIRRGRLFEVEILFIVTVRITNSLVFHHRSWLLLLFLEILLSGILHQETNKKIRYASF